MEFWATEVKSGETIEVKPGQDKCLHLTQANLGEVKKGKGTETVQLFVNVDGKKLVLGNLISKNLPNIQFDLLFDRDFELSHSWNGGSVYFFGYKIDNEDVDDDSDSYSEDDDDFPLTLGNTAKVEKPSDKKVIMETANGLPKSDDDDSSDSGDDDDSGSDDDSSDVNKSEGDSEDSEDGSEEDDSDESEEDESAKVEPGKKRASDIEPETPASKKKVKLTTPEKTDGKKGSGVHVDTPHPSKKSGKTKAATPNQKTRKN